jgi:hypothetical protein
MAKELCRGFKCIKRGLGEIDLINPVNDFYEPTLFFLSTGMERILKCMFCISHKAQHGRYPTSKEQPWKICRKGHDLIYLKELVTQGGMPPDSAEARMDHEFLENDRQLLKLLSILSAYGIKDRYFDLDTVVQDHAHVDDNSPTDRFDRFQSELADSVYGTIYTELADFSTQDLAFQKMNSATKALVERFARALTRQFIYQDFRTIWLHRDEYLAPFHELQDSELGKTRY